MKWVKRLADSVIVLTILVCASLACATAFVPVLGMEAYTVMTGSMEPEIATGSLVYVDTDVEGREIAADEIIAFDIEGTHDRICTHRVIENNIDSQSIRTKGDANDTADVSPVSYSQLVGRVVMSIPYIGSLCAYISENRFAVMSLILSVLGFASLLSWALSKKNKGFNRRGQGNAKRYTQHAGS